MGRTPKFSALGPMTRTSGARIPSFIRARSFSACDVYLVNPICCANYTPTPPIRQEKVGRDVSLSVQLILWVPPKRFQVLERIEQSFLHGVEYPQSEGIVSADVAGNGIVREVVRSKCLRDVQGPVDGQRTRSAHRSRPLRIE